MARFLFTVWPFPGCLFPHMAVAEALRERGHWVAFYTGSAVRSLVERAGFVVFPFSPALECTIESRVLSADGVTSTAMSRPWRLESQLRALFAGTIPAQIDDLTDALAQAKPDVIVCDPAMWGPIVVLHEAQPVPVALLSPYAACWLPGPDVSPPGSGLPRPKDWRTRLLARIGWAVFGVLRTRLHRTVNQLRTRYGLPALHTSVAAHMAELPLFLVPSCPEFDYERRDLPGSVHYVGPCLWYPPEDDHLRLGQLREDIPAVHVTEGTIHHGEAVVLKAAADGLAELPVEVIMSAGGRDRTALGLGVLPSNVQLHAWMSYTLMLPRMAAVVTTGGSGTVLAALLAGVPLVVVPVAWDQPENAQRVVEAGAGLRLSPRKCTPGRLRAAVEQVLSDPSYGVEARRLGSKLRELGGPCRAAALLETLASSKR